jgi:glycosyltransferase 2 family protein
MTMKLSGAIKTLLKVAVTVILLAYLLLSINLSAIVSTILGMDVFPLVLCIPLICVMYALRAEKWMALLRPIGINMPFYSALKIYLIGTFYGSVTPGRAGEVSRSFFMGDKKFKTIPTVIIDRFIDIICLLAFSIISIIVFFNSLTIFIIIALLTIVFAACAIALLHRGAISFIFRLLKLGDEHKEDYIGTVDATVKDRRAVAYAFTLTIAYYIVNTLVFWLILRALSTTINPIISLSLPVIIIMGNVPISISGLGVREFVSVTIFSMFKSSAAYGFSASLVTYLLTSLLPGLVGSIFTLEGVQTYGSEKREL